MRYTLAILCSIFILGGCATIDSIFGPPVGSMTKQQITDYCIKWPSDNVCQRWMKGDAPKCSDC
jgi:hypothetical protein